jgi:hypothetical protein
MAGGSIAPRVSVRRGYTLYHMIKLLDLLDAQGPLGRSLISRRLGIGEGSSRSLVRELRSLGLVETDPVGGSYLTDKGYSVIKMWREIVRRSICIEERLDPSPWGFLSISCISKPWASIILSRGILAIRDSIVRAGCAGALIMGIHGFEIYMLDTLGKPDVSISSTQLGRVIVRECGGGESLAIASSLAGSCIDSERCVWETIVWFTGFEKILGKST